MSMLISVDEGQIAEAIAQGELRLASIIEAMRLECFDDGEFADLVATDMSFFLDDCHLTAVSPIRRMLEAFEEAASNLATELNPETDE